MQFREIREKARDILSLATLWLLLAAVISSAYAQNYTNGQTPASDNTAVNVRDRSDDAVTADKAENGQSDRDIMAQIRKEIVDDSTISRDGHNVKVVAENGHVTLKGPVMSMSERMKIDKKASYVVGAENVTDKLSVERNH